MTQMSQTAGMTIALPSIKLITQFFLTQGRKVKRRDSFFPALLSSLHCSLHSCRPLSRRRCSSTIILKMALLPIILNSRIYPNWKLSCEISARNENIIIPLIIIFLFTLNLFFLSFHQVIAILNLAS